MADDSKSGQTVPVMTPTPAPGPYTYAVAPGTDAPPAGAIVAVPLGPRLVPAIVWDGPAGPVEARKLRAIEQVFDCPPVAAPMRRFIEWLADYTLSPPGMVARMALRAPAAFDPEPALEGIAFAGGTAERLTPARRRVIELAADGMAWTRSGLARAAGASASVVDGLVAQGLFKAVAIPPPPVTPLPDPDHRPTTLTAEQAGIAGTLRQAVRDGGFSVTLVDGVTGSGKTEVYFEAIAETLKAGRQVLALLPEIALTQAFLDRFHHRFGARPAEWHSELSPRMRDRVWRQVAEGRVRVVAGARSALFLPFSDLGLVIVDEEHDQAYKQEDRVHYNARDMAIVRAKLSEAPVILASATPSVETQVNARQGRYRRVRLSSRFADAALPDIASVDMRRHPPARGGFLSPVTLRAVEETIGRGEQALLFLNRRGYAPLTLCRACGHRFACSDCDAWLVEHRFRGTLNCHRCGHVEPKPAACPSCGTEGQLAACGPGVERLAEEVLSRFPEARVIVLSSDMAGGVKRLRLELEAIANGEADIVIGTQIVAKGHNFPGMTLVAAIDADLGLSNGDPRASERTFQLLHQVTGRAGRTGRASRGLIQTFQPDHPVMQAIISGDAQAFYDREIAERERAQLPPFGRLAAIIVTAASRGEAEGHARALARAAPDTAEIELLGPAEAPIAVIRGEHRFRLLAHGVRGANMQAYLRAMLANGPKPRGSIRVSVDVDPQSFG